MNFDKLYEKVNSLIALEIFNYGDSQKSLEKEFVPEFFYLNNMSNDIFSEEIEETQYEILKIYDVYFRNGIPMLTDSEYDGLYKIYEGHNGENTTPIMFEPSINAWEKVDHDIPMGSLDKQTTVDEIEKWNNKSTILGNEIVVSEKLDGISLEVIYKSGVFEKAVTRGNGKVGDDITENAQYFNGMVKELQEPWDCAIRGEVMITKENLVNINNILVDAGKEPLKNTRNGVSGQATKYKDRNEDILSLITFIAYDIQIFNVKNTGENVV
jgi:DNA ligase (NAD+)